MLLKILEKIYKDKQKLEIILDDFKFLYGSFILGILSLNNSGKISVKYKVKNQYLQNINFYKYLNQKLNTKNINFKNQIFLPIIPIYENINPDIVDKLCFQILDLSHQINNPKEYAKYYDILQRTFRELIDNSIQHSKANFYNLGSFFFIQKYTNQNPIKEYQNSINFIIIDNGIGFKNSFETNKIFFEKDEYYILKALEKLRTSNKERGAGNGLYYISKITKYTNSHLYIYSHNTLLIQTGDIIKTKKLDFEIKGTIINLVLNLNNFGKGLDKFFINERNENPNDIENKLPEDILYKINKKFKNN